MNAHCNTLALRGIKLPPKAPISAEPVNKPRMRRIGIDAGGTRSAVGIVQGIGILDPAFGRDLRLSEIAIVQGHQAEARRIAQGCVIAAGGDGRE
mgnify:CR=1 FL=1